MFVPPQGFRHAATLLLANSTRAIPVDASAEVIRGALERLANDLVGLADDTRAPVEVAAWLIAELNTTIDRLPQSFDREPAKSSSAAILARAGSRQPDIPPCDLFLIYAPEDRLPVAAPLAIELTKRHVSVAFADYEVATAQQLTEAVAHGLAHHQCGVVLWTRALERAQPQLPTPDNDRIRILRQTESRAVVSDLVAWTNQLKSGNAAK
jgi:hypothetical protein